MCVSSHNHCCCNITMLSVIFYLCYSEFRDMEPFYQPMCIFFPTSTLSFKLNFIFFLLMKLFLSLYVQLPLLQNKKTICTKFCIFIQMIFYHGTNKHHIDHIFVHKRVQDVSFDEITGNLTSLRQKSSDLTQVINLTCC